MRRATAVKIDIGDHLFLTLGWLAIGGRPPHRKVFAGKRFKGG